MRQVENERVARVKMKKSLEAREYLAAEWVIELQHLLIQLKLQETKDIAKSWMSAIKWEIDQADQGPLVWIDQANQICHILIKIQSLSQKIKNKSSDRL